MAAAQPAESEIASQASETTPTAAPAVEPAQTIATVAPASPPPIDPASQLQAAYTPPAASGTVDAPPAQATQVGAAAQEADPAAQETDLASQRVAQASDVAAAPTPAARPQADATETVIAAAAPQPAAAAPKKASGNLLSALFGGNKEKPRPAARVAAAGDADTPAARSASQKSQPELRAPAEDRTRVVMTRSTESSGTLPGVSEDGPFKIRSSSGYTDEEEDGQEYSRPVKVASAAGLARLAPNGLVKQTDRVQTECFKPALVRLLKRIESHYGKPVIVTSGYRSAGNNRRARGAKNSLHIYCSAADIQIEGVGKWQLAKYARSMSGRGGVGTYCHTDSVHIDIGPNRDWNWRCRRK